MRIEKFTAMLAVLGWLLSAAPLADAATGAKKSVLSSAAASAKRHSARRGSIHGEVTAHHKGVAGAKVHLAHKRHKHQAHTTKTAVEAKIVAAAKKSKAAKTAAAHKAHRHGVVTATGGHFALKSVHAGSHLVVAHKKHVGTGHARATVTSGGSAKVVIRLHKHHHHHSGTKTSTKTSTKNPGK